MIELGSMLMVNTHGTHLSLDGDALKVYRPDAAWKRLPLTAIDSIVIACNAQLSSQLVMRCAQDERLIVFLSPFGSPKATVSGSLGRGSDARHKQHLVHAAESQRLEMARRIVKGKIRSEHDALVKLNRNGTSADQQRVKRALEDLRTLEGACDDAPSRSSLLGYEGSAARAYFRALGTFVTPYSSIEAAKRRQRRPCTDPYNALLSFGYGMLAVQVKGGVLTSGLDANIGFLHGDLEEQPSLVLDLMEEFRSSVDMFVISLLNRKKIQKKHFEHQVSGAVLLNEPGRQVFFSEWHELRSRNFSTLALGGAPAPFAALPLLQARSLVKVLQGTIKSYSPWVVPL